MSNIKILGAYGGRSIDKFCASVQVSENILIDAGDVLNLIGGKAKKIDHIFLTHSHLDHIADIPFLIDAFFEYRTTPLNVYALKGTLENLQKFIFNWQIWPDFCEIELSHSKGNKAIKFHELSLNDEVIIDNVKLKPINTNHTPSSCGYVIEKENNGWLFTSDTYKCDEIWDELNKNQKIKNLIIDISFPSRLDELAKNSKHLTPNLLKQELDKLQRNDIKIFPSHLKPNFVDEIKKELDELNILNGGKVLDNGDIIK